MTHSFEYCTYACLLDVGFFREAVRRSEKQITSLKIEILMVQDDVLCFMDMVVLNFQIECTFKGITVHQKCYVCHWATKKTR